MIDGHSIAGIADVAADTGVSPTMVFLASSGKRTMSEKTRLKIRESVARLHYQPNLIARGLRSQKTHPITLLVADISNPCCPEVASGVHDVLTRGTYTRDGGLAAVARILASDTPPSAVKCAHDRIVIRAMDAARLAGLAIFA